MIDFGYSKKIPIEYMNEIKTNFQQGNMLNILRIIFGLGRSDNLEIYNFKSFYGWAAGFWDLRRNVEITEFPPYINPSLIDLFGRRDYAITEAVQYFDWLHAKDPEEYPLLPLSNSVKNKMFSGLISGGQKRGGKWSKKYKRSINCNRPKGFSQKQYCKYGRK